MATKEGQGPRRGKDEEEEDVSSLHSNFGYKDTSVIWTVFPGPEGVRICIRTPLYFN